MLAALASAIQADGGRRCPTCLNYEAQPFCGMTGKPHKLRLKNISVKKSQWTNSIDVVSLVFSYLLPWECVAIRKLNKALWVGSLQQNLWERYILITESIIDLHLPEVFYSPSVNRRWKQSLVSLRQNYIKMPSIDRHATHNPEYKYYSVYVSLGVLSWRRKLEEIFSPTIKSLREDHAGDICAAIVDSGYSLVQLQNLHMADVDELHNCFSVICTASNLMRNVYSTLRKNKKTTLQPLYQYSKELHKNVNLLTKIHQWVNCVSDIKYWLNMKAQLARMGYLLPDKPRKCPVSVITTIFSECPQQVKLAWDQTISAANDDFNADDVAVESENGGGGSFPSPTAALETASLSSSSADAILPPPP